MLRRLMLRRRLLVPVLVVAFVTAASSAQSQARTKVQTPPKPTVSSEPKTQPLPPQALSETEGWDERVIKVSIVGQANVYIPKHPTSSNVILFISGDGGWNLGVVDMARRIMPKAIVIGVSYVALRKALPAAATQCWFPSGDLEVIAQSAEHQLKLPDYQPPILMGYSSGATMVYYALVASPYSFAGGLSMGFCPDMPSNHPACAADNFKPGPWDAKTNSVLLPKVDRVSRDWYVVNGIQDQVCLPAEMHKFIDDIAGAHFIEAPGSGHGFGRPARWGPSFDEAIDKLLASATEASRPKPAPPAPAGSAAALESKFDALNLPLEYRWANQSRAVLVFVSGDGNWAAIDDHLAQYLTARDVSVVGLKARSYFWNERTPQQAGADLSRIVSVASELHVPVFVGGYSFGAEVVPFMLETWPAADRRKVAGEILVAPSRTASFQFHFLDLVMRARETPRQVADAVRRIRVPTSCLAGQAEDTRDTACDALSAPSEVVKLPGSHHFNGKYDDVGAVILAFIDKHAPLARDTALRVSARSLMDQRAGSTDALTGRARWVRAVVIGLVILAGLGVAWLRLRHFTASSESGGNRRR